MLKRLFFLAFSKHNKTNACNAIFEAADTHLINKNTICLLKHTYVATPLNQLHIT